MNNPSHHRGRRDRLLAALRHFCVEADEIRTMANAPKGVGWSTVDDLEEAKLIENVATSERGSAAAYRTTDAGHAVLNAEDPVSLLPPYRRRWEWPTSGYSNADFPLLADAEPVTPPASKRKRGARLKPDRSLQPRGLNRADAAWYIGVGVSKFDEMVRDGRMPAPKHVDSRRIWDRIALDDAFDELPSPNEESNSWDIVL